MPGLGAIGFAAPWLLVALAALPVIWWLVRLTPPAPRQVQFPAMRLLMDLTQRQETPDRTPWWLILLRLLLAALVIIGLAGPILNPVRLAAGSGPLLIVVDDGWAAASRWSERMAAIAPHIAAAEQAGRPVRLLTTAPGIDGIAPPALLPFADLKGNLAALEPKPWAVDRQRALAALNSLGADAVTETLWLADGVDDGNAQAFSEKLTSFGPVTRLDLEPGNAAFALGQPAVEDKGFTIEAARALADGPRRLTIVARNEHGQILARSPVDVGAGEQRATATVELPPELRNQVTRIDIAEEASAAAVHLLDNRWRRRVVGIAFEGGDEEVRPLVSEAFYLERALKPFADVRTSSLGDLLKSPPSVIVLADVGQVPAAQRPALEEFIRKGGVLLRFAGPRFATSADDLVPVKLRQGDRALGGALSWTQPAPIAPFAPESPFAGLVASPEVRIYRQVLAEPSLELDSRTWARLADGTPLITGTRRGAGLIVLVHTSANSSWSNLALSGLFVDMLRRVIALSEGEAVAAETERSLAPLASLDGRGRLGTPLQGAGPISAEAIETEQPSPRNPPGFYGDPSARRALNLTPPLDSLAPLPTPSGITITLPQAEPATPLGPALIVAALVMALIDLLVALRLSGRLVGATAAVLLACVVTIAAAPRPALAVDAVEAAGTIRLAYVLTGDGTTDDMSEAGLRGLSQALTQRTSVEPGEPVAVNLEADELAFYPMIYWPMVPGQAPSPVAIERIDAYLKAGGVVLFDTRDASQGAAVVPGFASSAPGEQALREALSQLDVPPLVPLPAEHVLTKSFYLLQNFPGRYDGGPLWIEANASAENDGVSGFIIGPNDWAAAWAVDGQGRPMAALEPGGTRQRELALRFGVNLVMYALTGNYKADQVHVPALLERLGQ